MSNTSKTILCVIAIVLVIWGISWLMGKPSSNTNVTENSTPAQNQVPASNSSSGTESVSNASDASINSDLNSVDSQINGLNADEKTATPASDNNY